MPQKSQPGSSENFFLHNSGTKCQCRRDVTLLFLPQTVPHVKITVNIFNFKLLQRKKSNASSCTANMSNNLCHVITSVSKGTTVGDTTETLFEWQMQFWSIFSMQLIHNCKLTSVHSLLVFNVMYRVHKIDRGIESNHNLPKQSAGKCNFK